MARPAGLARTSRKCRCYLLRSLFLCGFAFACQVPVPDSVGHADSRTEPAAIAAGEPILSVDRARFPFVAPAQAGGYWLGASATGLASDGQSALLLAHGDNAGPGAAWPAQQANLFVNWADVPAICELEPGTLVLAWLERFASPAQVYRARYAFSADGGRSFGPAHDLASDSRGPEYGFVSLVPYGSEQCFAVWLDGRASSGHEGGGAMALACALLGADGRKDGERLLDERVCDCCPTTAVALPDGSCLIAYRDRSSTEVRDITLARGNPNSDAAWTFSRVREDGWQIAGCPVNGPKLTADGEQVALAWFTAAAEEPRVYVAFSDDAGAHFGEVQRADLGAPLGRVDLCSLPAGRVLLAWLEADGPSARWCARVLHPDQGAAPAVTIARVTPAREEGHLRLARVGGSVHAIYTERSRSGLACVRLDPDDLARN